jgi:hypothetical protein
MQVDFDRYMDVLVAAKERHMAPETLRRALREGRIDGKKIGHQWWVLRLEPNRTARFSPITTSRPTIDHGVDVSEA